MTVVAQQGGYLNRKGDGPPGFECLWKGYAILNFKVDAIQLYLAAKTKPRRLMRRRKFVGHA
jgi:hypothetical protein